ncbi:MAG: hypothetical protein WKG03_14760 [Telluria sp.]
MALQLREQHALAVHGQDDGIKSHGADRGPAQVVASRVLLHLVGYPDGAHGDVPHHTWVKLNLSVASAKLMYWLRLPASRNVEHRGTIQLKAPPADISSPDLEIEMVSPVALCRVSPRSAGSAR